MLGVCDWEEMALGEIVQSICYKTKMLLFKAQPSLYTSQHPQVRDGNVT